MGAMHPHTRTRFLFLCCEAKKKKMRKRKRNSQPNTAAKFNHWLANSPINGSNNARPEDVSLSGSSSW